MDSPCLLHSRKMPLRQCQHLCPTREKSEFCLPKAHIYLESCSTYISFFNPDLLEDICQVNTMILGHANEITSKINWVGSFWDLEAWLDTNGISNVFGIPDLKKAGYHITYESGDGLYIVTNKTTIMSVKFQEGDDRMPYIQATEENKAFVQSVSLNFVHTVLKNY